MVSVPNNTKMSAFAIPQQDLSRRADAVRHELQGSLFLAAESYREAGEYDRALDLYLRNIDGVAFDRAVEDAYFGTLADILKDEVGCGVLAQWCGRPDFFVQDEFHSYTGAAKCAQNLGKDDLFKFCLNAAVNIGIKRAPEDKIYYDYVADCYELLGDREKATGFRNRFCTFK